MQAAEKTHVLNLHRGEEAVTPPPISCGDGFPDQPLADLIVPTKVGMHAEPSAVPEPRFRLNNANHTDDIGVWGLNVVLL